MINSSLVMIKTALGYPFIQKAMLCGIFTAVSSSLLGVFLVLRRLSLISDGLSHVAFAAIALSLLAGVNHAAVSIPLVITASLLILRLPQKAFIYTDTAIALIASVSVAAGVMMVSMGRGFNIDIYSYLFGSILAVGSFEAELSAAVMSGVIISVILFYNEWILISFDPDFAKTKKINIFLNDLLFVLMQSLVIVTGVRIVGALLMSSLIIFPAVSALQLAVRFRIMVLLSVVFSLISVVSGILVSFVLNTPTGATIVCVSALVFVISFIINNLFRIK